MRLAKVNCTNYAIHFLILSTIHCLYSYAVTQKAEKIRFVGYFAFVYAIAITFISMENVNKLENTCSEIVFFATIQKLSNDQRWGEATQIYSFGRQE